MIRSKDHRRSEAVSLDPDSIDIAHRISSHLTPHAQNALQHKERTESAPKLNRKITAQLNYTKFVQTAKHESKLIAVQNPDFSNF